MLELLTSFGGSLAIALPAFIAVLTVVVFFHELGHFLVARWCGVSVKTFSVGFGPELLGYTDRRGTRWKLSAVPLGGYVKFIDDLNAASAPERGAAKVRGSFQSMSVWRRAAIVAAGPAANFILAILIYALLFGTLGRTISAPVVDQIAPGSAAEQAGFQPGDLIVSINGRTTPGFTDVQRIVFRSAELPLDVEVDRGGRMVMLQAVPRAGETRDVFGNTQKVGLLGISHKPTAITQVRYGPIEAVGQAAAESWNVVSATMGYLGGVIVGRESPDQIGGPIGIAKVSGQAASLGVIPLINLVAVLSVSIGLLNLFPIPLLDGGHLVYYAIEALRGRPLSEKAQDIGFRIGFAIVVMLMVFGTFNDVIRGVAGF
jgi:regulator of sigma E protease